MKKNRKRLGLVPPSAPRIRELQLKPHIHQGIQTGALVELLKRLQTDILRDLKLKQDQMCHQNQLFCQARLVIISGHDIQLPFPAIWTP